MSVGIEAIHPYLGQAAIDVRDLFAGRGLSLDRFDNLMMRRKSVALPCEDPVTHAVNAARPLVSRMDPSEVERIELVIAATESGLDFGKALSTYVHHHLGLPRSCRVFEVKHACYGGVAALQMAAALVASNASPGAKALVVATDVAGALEAPLRREMVEKGEGYHEPSSGTGAVAMVIGDRPDVLELDAGAHGFHSFEVMDTCRPVDNHERGDADLSLLTYLDCLEGSFADYARRVDGADYVESFDYLAFHTPFAGMVKGAHRRMMRRQRPGSTPDQIDADFERRIAPSLRYCVEVGNVYSATVFLALCGVLAHESSGKERRVGLFGYGSGCSSEFWSGVIGARSHRRFVELEVERALERRRALSIAEYDRLLDLNCGVGFGVENGSVDVEAFADLYDQQVRGRGLLVLRRIEGFHRVYEWS
jgi:polyketide biosynthesis 3-hydroxy-3-methylglutaryl-CoA synthase-like enzyme PksG